jgi:hypothetical protein
MRVVVIEIESERGTARISRDELMINVHGSVPGRPGLAISVDAGETDHIWEAAEELQMELDGFRGTKGDVNEYFNILVRFDV